MRTALYARVSTSDRDQDPETQLVALRDFAKREGLTVVGEYVDRAPANDLLHRTEWRHLLDDIAKGRVQGVAVFKLDRAFRSVKHMADTIDLWNKIPVDFRSVREGFDTGTAVGRLMVNLLASLAEFELSVLSERVRAGMDRARRQGKAIGRPRVEVPPAKWRKVREALESGELSRRKASQMLGIGQATLRRLLKAEEGAPKRGSA